MTCLFGYVQWGVVAGSLLVLAGSLVNKRSRKVPSTLSYAPLRNFLMKTWEFRTRKSVGF